MSKSLKILLGLLLLPLLLLGCWISVPLVWYPLEDEIVYSDIEDYALFDLDDQLITGFELNEERDEILYTAVSSDRHDNTLSVYALDLISKQSRFLIEVRRNSTRESIITPTAGGGFYIVDVDNEQLIYVEDSRILDQIGILEKSIQEASDLTDLLNMYPSLSESRGVVQIQHRPHRRRNPDPYCIYEQLSPKVALRVSNSNAVLFSPPVTSLYQEELEVSVATQNLLVSNFNPLLCFDECPKVTYVQAGRIRYGLRGFYDVPVSGRMLTFRNGILHASGGSLYELPTR